jgi:hypothetical protein
VVPARTDTLNDLGVSSVCAATPVTVVAFEPGFSVDQDLCSGVILAKIGDTIETNRIPQLAKQMLAFGP